eukprot:8443210-Alexandrium_andersonii.AAC.1
MALVATQGGVGKHMGIVLHQAGQAEGVLQHAAKNCFWTLGVDTLSKLAASLALLSAPTRLAELLRVLIVEILGPLSDEALAAILGIRGQAPIDPIEQIVDKDALKEGMSKDEQKEVEDAQG